MADNERSAVIIAEEDGMEYDDLMNLERHPQEGKSPQESPDDDLLAELLGVTEGREEAEEDILGALAQGRPFDFTEKVELAKDALTATNPESILDEQAAKGHISVSEAGDMSNALATVERESALVLDSELVEMLERGEIRSPEVMEAVSSAAKEKIKEEEEKREVLPETIEEQKQHLLTKLVELRERYPRKEFSKIPSEELYDFREVMSEWSDEDKKNWRFSMGTYILMQAELPTDRRKGVNTYLDTLEAFFDKPDGVKDSVLARSAYILYSILHNSKKLTLSRWRVPPLYTVTNFVRIKGAADEWLKAGNRLENPQAQKLIERSLGYINTFILSIRGWEELKKRIIIDEAAKTEKQYIEEISNAFIPKTKEEQILYMQSFVTEKKKEVKELLGQMRQMESVDQAFPILEELGIIFALIEREEKELKEIQEGKREIEHPPEITEQYIRGIALLKKAKELYERAQDRTEFIAHPPDNLKMKTKKKSATTEEVAGRSEIPLEERNFPENLKQLLHQVRQRDSSHQTKRRQKTGEQKKSVIHEIQGEASDLIAAAKTYEQEAMMYLEGVKEDKDLDSLIAESGLIDDPSESEVDIFEELMKGGHNE